MTALLAVSGVLLVAYLAIVLAWYKSKQLDRKLRAEPFVPAYEYEPPRRRRSDRTNKEESDALDDHRR